MSGKSINTEDKNMNKSIIYKSIKLFKIEGIDINKILVSKKESFVKKNSVKYFIAYNDAPLCIKLSRTIGYVKHFQRGNKTMPFKASDNKLLKKYNKIWENVSSLMKVKFDTEPIYIDKCIKTKIDSYEGRINTNFEGKKYQKKMLHISGCH